ncbi:MBL fold metallo-hydrolase [Streptomyces poriferorum]|uniref:MBL fold metallo-hydrolase n=1 Tax=Streptomyces poriferorum TaxID=2798799 RepID=A0ABY9IMB7_9ACTN|nr:MULTISPECIES: MBL fold metallo-hydrolase [unclassified Streptomyces]MDP5317046.1 MBL fold metallo-hydrolase [Streptomyces sp. Alt4]WLQ51929.1 MBL fold metallo-hydrolase [Streptomyces sp. Alt1]WLQ55318.1 MBL fold metallo-hydrolase [Streptomyces sp. Alt2]WSI66799.1 MBL fold metallo-hydrolase [Streptomyces sp. NBC_01336]
MKATLTHVGTATVLLEIGGFRLLTDPVFDPAPAQYRFGPATLKSTAGPALTVAELPEIDAVLLSHDEHPDNLDTSGRALLARRTVLTTKSGAGRLQDGAVGLEPWESHELTRDGERLRITATPGLHAGDVIGFVVELSDEGEALYISGDTINFDALDEIGQRFTIGTAILHFGAAQVDEIGELPITLDGAQGVELVRSLRAKTVVPVHYASWAHFSRGPEDVVTAFEQAGLTDRLHWLVPGIPTTLG